MLPNDYTFVSTDMIMKFDKYIQFSYMNAIKYHKYHQTLKNIYTFAHFHCQNSLVL